MAGGAGFWLGKRSAQPIRFGGYHCIYFCAIPHFSTDSFEIINEEIPKQIESLLGVGASKEIMVVVTPESSGYFVHMAGSYKSAFWSEMTQSNLYDWIRNKMNALEQYDGELHKDNPKAIEAVGATNAPQSRR